MKLLILLIFMTINPIYAVSTSEKEKNAVSEVGKLKNIKRDFQCSVSGDVNLENV